MESLKLKHQQKFSSICYVINLGIQHHTNRGILITERTCTLLFHLFYINYFNIQLQTKYRIHGDKSTFRTAFISLLMHSKCGKEQVNIFPKVEYLFFLPANKCLDCPLSLCFINSRAYVTVAFYQHLTLITVLFCYGICFRDFNLNYLIW